MNLPYDLLLFASLFIGSLGSESSSGSFGLTITSPLKTLTIFDETVNRPTFLERFKIGTTSQNRVRKEIQEEEARKRKEEEEGVVYESMSEFEEDVAGEDEVYEASKWEEYSLSKEEAVVNKKLSKLEKAFDEGFNSVKKSSATNRFSNRDENKYQFVGVVIPKQNVKWYARKKPKSSRWSVRLLQVDKPALQRDLFVNGKIDIFAEYENRGRMKETIKDGKKVEQISAAVIEPKYSIRERSWRTLWNINPVNYFSQRSGMFWRERRLHRQGLYTDGKNLYESTYRYTEGKNGMKPIANIDFDSFLKKWDIDPADKDTILNKVNNESPDIVLEY